MTVETLAREAAMSRSTFFDRFRKEVGVAPIGVTRRGGEWRLRRNSYAKICPWPTSPSASAMDRQALSASPSIGMWECRLAPILAQLLLRLKASDLTDDIGGQCFGCCLGKSCFRKSLKAEAAHSRDTAPERDLEPFDVAPVLQCPISEIPVLAGPADVMNIPDLWTCPSPDDARKELTPTGRERSGVHVNETVMRKGPNTREASSGAGLT